MSGGQASCSLVLTLIIFALTTSYTLQAELSVDQLHVESVITHRFATTHVTSVLTNLGDQPEEATFDIQLPKDAFISNFSMLIGGKVYVGEIEGKEEAQRTYDAAVGRGQSAGHLRARESNKFAASVNVAAMMNVTFELSYQELLERRLGLYEHVIYIDPGQLVEDFQVDVYIVESRVITDLSVPRISNDLITDVIIDDTNEYAHIEMLSASSAHISFSPSLDEQRRYASSGISGQFIVNYDVEHDAAQIGEILVVDGYFVHFFAPVWLEPLSKRVMFVLDVSGSMSGTKIRQMKEALVTILEDLSMEDEFGIITFSNGVKRWNEGEILSASDENIYRAKQYADTLHASGGTNINAALLRGIDLLSGDSGKAAMLIFLTDGQATSGVTGQKEILQNVREANINDVSIFSLAFGQGADFQLVQKISAQNNGLARKIYEDADASLQLAGFYDEISSPLLSQLKIKYIGDIVDNSTLTESTIHCLFDGAEMVVAGRLVQDNNTVPTINLNIEGNLVDSTLVIEQTLNLTDTPVAEIPSAPAEGIQDFTQRLWVYLTIKQLITTTYQATDLEKVKEAKNEAMELALKYNFVTPFTSMVVTKPGDGEGEDREVMGGRRGEADEDLMDYDDVYYDVPSYSQYSGPSSSYGNPGLAVGFQPRGPSSSYGNPGLSSNYGGHAYNAPVGVPVLRKQSIVPMARPVRPAMTYSQVKTTPRTRPIYALHPIAPLTTTTHRTRPTYYTTTTTTTRPPTVKNHGRKKSKNARRPSKGKSAPKGRHYDRRGPSTASVHRPIKNDPPALYVRLQDRQTRGADIAICFDMPSTTGNSRYTLLQTPEIHMEGKLTRRYKNGKKFDKVSLTSPNATVEFSTRSFRVDGQRSIAWWQLKKVDLSQGEVTPEGGVLFDFGEVNITVSKHGIESRRSRAKPFLSVTVSVRSSGSQRPSGLVGQILKLKKVEMKTDSLTYHLKGRKSTPAQDYILQDGSTCSRLTEASTVKKILKI